MQQRLAQLQNAVMVRKAGKIALNLKAPFAVEQIKIYKTKLTTKRTMGMILEQAEKECGGPEKLLRALQRGDVKKGRNEEGTELYFFPTVAAV